MRFRFSAASHSLLVLVVYTLSNLSSAIVIPRQGGESIRNVYGGNINNVNDRLGNAAVRERTKAKEKTQIRIRVCRETDLDAVSTMLSKVLVPTTNGFRESIERLRTKTMLQAMLSSRIKAIDELKSLIGSQPLKLSDADQLRKIWTKGSLVNKIESAAKKSQEPHMWNNHNFALVPDDPSWLNHLILTVEDDITKEIIGFCEIAMLAPPQNENGNILNQDDETCLVFQNDDNEFEETSCVPTLANLVTSPEHRRKGIAKRIIRTAEAFVKMKWGRDQLGLYVEKTNTPAISLYKKMGYLSFSSESDEDEKRAFMMKNLSSGLKKGVKKEIVDEQESYVI